MCHCNRRLLYLGFYCIVYKSNQPFIEQVRAEPPEGRVPPAAEDRGQHVELQLRRHRVRDRAENMQENAYFANEICLF